MKVLKPNKLRVRFDWTTKITPQEFDRAFARKSDQDFIKVLSLNWSKLEKDRDCAAFWLYQSLRPRRGKPTKYCSFVIFILLCLKRPWENDWKISLSERRGREWHREVDQILGKINADYLTLDIQTLRKYLKKSDLKRKILNTILNPSLFQLKYALQMAFNSVKINTGIVFRLIDKLHREKFVLKRDLQRKYHRHKNQLNFLLEKWKKEGAIEEVKFPGGAAIISIGSALRRNGEKGTREKSIRLGRV